MYMLHCHDERAIQARAAGHRLLPKIMLVQLWPMPDDHIRIRCMYIRCESDLQGGSNTPATTGAGGLQQVFLCT